MAGRSFFVVWLALAAAGGPACNEGRITESSLALTIRCAASPASGTAPLSVAFGLDVANALGPLSVAIHYGDGTQGTDPDARHVYTAAGDYMASMTVSAGIETARCSMPIGVTPAPAPAPTPTPLAANRPPDAVFRTTPAASGASLSGTAPFRVDYNMCTTVDPDGDRLYFRMDLDGDGAFELHGSTGVDCRHGTTYSAGTRTATQCVTDVDCPSWPLCEGIAPLHAFQCRSYTVIATP